MWTNVNLFKIHAPNRKASEWNIGKFLNKWGITDNATCDCEKEKQSIDRILKRCRKQALIGNCKEIAMLFDQAKEQMGKLYIHF